MTTGRKFLAYSLLSSATAQPEASARSRATEATGNIFICVQPLHENDLFLICSRYYACALCLDYVYVLDVYIHASVCLQVHVYVHIHILLFCPHALYVVNILSVCKAC